MGRGDKVSGKRMVGRRVLTLTNSYFFRPTGCGHQSKRGVEVLGSPSRPHQPSYPRGLHPALARACTEHPPQVNDGTTLLLCKPVSSGPAEATDLSTVLSGLKAILRHIFVSWLVCLFVFHLFQPRHPLNNY